MSNDHTTSQSAALLRIEGECTIFRAAELRELLLAEPGPDEIDLSLVTEMDSAGLQLLMAAKQRSTSRQRTLRLSGHSPAVLEVFELLNVAGYFNDPLVMEARK